MEIQLVKQLKILLKQNDDESIKYILADQTKETMNALSSHFSPQQNQRLSQLLDIILKQNLQIQQEPLQTKEARNNKIDDFIKGENENHESRQQNFFQMISKIHQKLIYEEQYGYPFYDLFKRILSTHGDSNPTAFTIKALHSQVQILYNTLFSQEVIKAIHEKYKNFPEGLKNYLNIVFPNHLQKFYKFNRVYKNIKKQTNDEYPESPDEQQIKEINESLDETLEIDEKEFIVSYSEAMNNQQFQQFQKNRSYNMLCFSAKNFKTLLSLPVSFYAYYPKEKEFLDIISFLSMRFTRKIIFTIIRNRANTALQQIKEQITPKEIKIIGNEEIDMIDLKIRQFVIPVKSNQTLAKEAFLDEFHTYSYKDFVPLKMFSQSVDKDVSVEEQIWNKSRQYRTLWVQRIKAQRYFKEGGHKPQIDYINFIENHKEEYKSDSQATWKMFIMTKFGFQPSKLERKPQKRMKLQSLKD